MLALRAAALTCVARGVARLLGQAGGKGWGALRYGAGPSVRTELHRLHRPAASFNYVGRLTALHELTGGLFLTTAERGRTRYAGARRDHVIAVVVGVQGDQVVMRWQYDSARHAPEHVEDIAAQAAAELPGATAAARSSGCGGMSLQEINELFADLHRQSR